MAVVRETLEALAELDSALEKRAEWTDPIAKMRRDQIQFRTEVDALAASIGLPPRSDTLSAIQNENSLIFSASPFIGAADLLAALAERKDVRLGIATGHLSHAIAPALERFGWQRHFCTVQTADKAPSKPHPGMILQALSEAAVKAEDAIMIGDTAYDIEMARAADVRGVAVSWGYHRPDRLRDAGAWRVVNGMSELRDCLFESISSASHEP
jgi:phosphoglycolate phosphatase-like HAD superfamily hydrolase